LGEGIGNFLNDVGVSDILDTKLHGVGTCLGVAGCLFRCVIVADRMLYGVKSANRETGTE
jgi:hypothetical protein